MKPILEARNLHAWYGEMEVLKGVDVKVGEGEIVAIIGPNGSGKSTTLKAVYNLIRKSGKVAFNGEDISKLRAEKLVPLGFTLVPQGRRVFATMTVDENLQMGGFTLKHTDLEKRKKYVFSLFPILKEKLHGNASSLSGGQQQQLAIARALMLEPKLLALDEPSLGLDPKTVRLVFDKIVEINKSGTTILLVEQNAHMALEIADRAYVLEDGKVRLSGRGKALLKRKDVQRLYLGG
jgi:branched-chain amino acid transport system ATP-binding protein